MRGDALHSKMETTTIQIYREDLLAIESQCKRNENHRDKLHQIVREWDSKQKSKKAVTMHPIALEPKSKGIRE